MFLPKQQQRELEKIAKQAYPSEICGFWYIDSEQNSCLAPLVNLEQEPASHHSFQADSLEVLKLLQANDQERISLQGIYHSHPDAPPILSTKDLSFFQFGSSPAYPSLLLLLISFSISSKANFVYYQWSQESHSFQVLFSQ